MRRYGTSGLVLGIEVFVLIVVVFLAAVGIVFGTRAKPADNIPIVSESHSNSWDTESESSEEPVTEPEPTYSVEDRLEFSKKVEDRLSKMSLEEKVAQVFIISPEALTDVKAATKAGNATQKAVETYPVGGLLYDSKNFHDKQQISQLTGKTQEYCTKRIGIEMFIAVEEEGGSDHSPLGKALGTTLGASPSELQGKDNAEAAKAAATIAGYLKETGFNMNLAVSMPLASAQTPTYKEKGIFSILKRYPGDDSENDGVSVVQEGISAGASCVMLGNATAPELTGVETLPCSVSEKVVTKLRSELEYEGIIMTDSFSDPAISGRYKSGQAAIMALQAGVDMVYMPADFKSAYAEVIAAVNAKEISMDMLDNAVGRILTVKDAAGMLKDAE